MPEPESLRFLAVKERKPIASHAHHPKPHQGAVMLLQLALAPVLRDHQVVIFIGQRRQGIGVLLDCRIGRPNEIDVRLELIDHILDRSLPNHYIFFGSNCREVRADVFIALPYLDISKFSA